MYSSMLPVASFVAGFGLLSVVEASYLNNDLSFGHNDRLSPHGRAVPNWHLIGQPAPPEILSNKLVLTPPVPGNQRGAAWAENALHHNYWTVDVDFRATGPERGTGNLNIWYVKDGQHEVGTSSIYTAGRFDGLALVIDQYAGTAGFIRGFLNDGSKNYKDHHSVDSLAFGHCEYSYRNLGRPSRIALSQFDNGLHVTVDGRKCFSSDQITLPMGNYFGITAATSENPDSFEVFKFVTTTESHTPDGTPSQQKIIEGRSDNGQSQPNQQASGDLPVYFDPPDAAASSFTTSSEQFADLHNRLQSMMKHISALTRDMNMHQGQYIEKQNDLVTRMMRLESNVWNLQKLEEKIDVLLVEIAEKVGMTESAIHNNINRSVRELKGDMLNTHSTLHGHLAEVHSMLPGFWKLILLLLCSQFVLIAAYVVYKKRKGRHSKKYL